MAERADSLSILQLGSGYCERCGKFENTLYMVTLSSGTQTDSMEMCRSCAMKLRKRVEKQNAKAIASGQTSGAAPVFVQKFPEPEPTQPRASATQPQKNGDRDSVKLIVALVILVVLIVAFAVLLILLGGKDKTGSADAAQEATQSDMANTIRIPDEIAQALRTSRSGYIAAGVSLTLGVKNDGTVFEAGSGYNNVQEAVAEWSNIVAVAARAYHAVGLHADGTVVAAGHDASGQCSVERWKDIVAIAAGVYHTVGLRRDGTVVSTEYTGGAYDYGQCDVSGWNDIVSISAGWAHTVGLRADGTVVATGQNEDGECDVSEWSGIKAIAAGRYHTVGLLSDGTVIAKGSDDYNQCEVRKWTDIVAIAAGSFHTVGLRADGTVVVAGMNRSGENNVDDWSQIVAVAAGLDYTVGLRKDGTAVATGDNNYRQGDLDAWSGLNTPEVMIQEKQYEENR